MFIRALNLKFYLNEIICRFLMLPLNPKIYNLFSKNSTECFLKAILPTMVDGLLPHSKNVDFYAKHNINAIFDTFESKSPKKRKINFFLGSDGELSSISI